LPSKKPADDAVERQPIRVASNIVLMLDLIIITS